VLPSLRLCPQCRGQRIIHVTKSSADILAFCSLLNYHLTQVSKLWIVLNFTAVFCVWDIMHSKQTLGGIKKRHCTIMQRK
jgi:hypothetical protein